MSSATTSPAPPSPPAPPLQQQQQQQLNPYLPDDIALNCVARIPRCHHPTLSLVCKPFRSLLSSPLLFTTRTLINSIQHFLYISLRSNSSIQFFTLSENPQKSTNPKFLVPVPPIPSPSIGSAYAAIGPKIYVIGGSINDFPSPHVWILDCRFNKWEIGPKMRVGREFAAAGVVDGKIYVMGGCVVDTWARAVNWAEVFDPVMGQWEAVLSPVEVREKWMHASAVVDGKIYAMADRGGVVYDPKSKVWESVATDLDLGWRGRAAVVDGILYCYDYLGKIRGFDVKEGLWKELRGMEKELPKFLCGATMANVGGKLVVVWEVKGSGKEMEVWCGEIEIEKRRDGELWGKIYWSDSILALPNGSAIVHCLAVSF